MKVDKMKATIKEYVNKLVEDKLTGKGDMIALKNGDKMVVTEEGVDFKDLTLDNIKEVNLNGCEGQYKELADIFLAREDINALCHCHPAWVNPVAELGLTIPAVLDDMAQIVGPSCKTSKNDINTIIKTLKGRNSCLVKGNGCVTSGRTMDEAYTCVLVLDKSAHCYVASSVIGPNKIINGLEARLMRFVYKTKYSKKNQENISNQEGEN